MSTELRHKRITIADYLDFMPDSVLKNIRQLREAKGLTLHDFAKEAGISYTYASQIETGAKVPTLEVLDRVASLLDVKVCLSPLAEYDVTSALTRLSGDRRETVLRVAQALAEAPDEAAQDFQASVRFLERAAGSARKTA